MLRRPLRRGPQRGDPAGPYPTGKEPAWTTCTVHRCRLRDDASGRRLPARRRGCPSGHHGGDAEPQPGWVRIKVKGFGAGIRGHHPRVESDPGSPTRGSPAWRARCDRPGRRGQRAAPGPAGGDHDGRHGPVLRRLVRAVRDRPRRAGHTVRDRSAAGGGRCPAGDVPDRLRLPRRGPRSQGGAEPVDPRRHLHGRAERGHDREGPRSHRAVHHPQPGPGRGTAGRRCRSSSDRRRHHRRPGARADAGRRKVPVAKVYHGLEQARAAQADVETGTTPGKHLVLFDD